MYTSNHVRGEHKCNGRCSEGRERAAVEAWHAKNIDTWHKSVARPEILDC